MLRVAAELQTVGALKRALAGLEDSLPLSFAGLEGLALHLRWGISGPCVVVDEPGSDAQPDEDRNDHDG